MKAFKTLAAALTLASTMALVAGCGGGGGGTPTINPGSVSGTLLDSAGAPISGALVVVGSSSWSDTTDLLGKFSIANVPAGAQPVAIYADGYILKTGAVVVTTGTDSALPAADTTVTADANAADNPVLSAAAATAVLGGVTLSVAVADADADISKVKATSPELAMSVTLNDDGAGGDTTAGDGTYSATVTLTTAQAAQLSNWHFSAYDAANNVSNILTLTSGTAAATSSISDLFGRNTDGTALKLGIAYTIQGTVLVDSSILATKKLRIHIQDSTGGIAVQAEEDVAADLPTVNPGDSIKVTGIITQEPVLDNSIGTVYLKINSASDLTVVSTGNAEPSAYEINGADCVAQYQTLAPTLGGRLIKLGSVTLTDASQWPKANAKSTDLTIQDAAGNTMIMRIQKNADIKGSTAPAGYFSVVALPRQNDSNADGDYNDEYTIWPRAIADFGTAVARVIF